MQASFSVRVFVEVCERKARTKLSADLFGKGMRKLPAAVLFFKLFAMGFVTQRIKRKRIDNFLFFLIDKIVDTGIESAQQNTAFFKHAKTFGKYRLNFFDIAVAYRMKNNIERGIGKGQRL